MKLAKKVLKRDVLSLSRMISMIEAEENGVDKLMKHIHPYTGKAHRIGVTGPPGVGKSTLVDKLIIHMRKEGLKIGIITVDPSSAFSGGALLGDRIRMQQHCLDSDVYIRSMGSRGCIGGLSKNVSSVIKALDAFGKDIILIETVGVGQTEIDIAKNADTVIVALSPESGDSIQSAKAGLLEIADIFVVNKSDRPGAVDFILTIETMVRLFTSTKWEMPVIKAEAVNNLGIEELYKRIQEHRHYLKETNLLFERRQQQTRNEFIERVKE
jgi:LAO/AO transport system kinase